MFRTINVQKRYLGPDPDPKETPPAPKTFTEAEVQAQIDSVLKKRLAEEKKKGDVERAEYLARIAKLEPDAQKAAELQAQVDELERKGKSQHELAEMDRKKERALLEATAKEKDAEAAKWRKRHEQTQLERDLMDVAGSKDADFVNSSQGFMLLKQNARIQPKLVDGKPTEDLETRIKVQTVKDGKPLELDLTPAEAVKVMKENKDNFNLFNAGVKGGLGGTQTQNRLGPGGKLGLTQAEFTKHYAKGTLPKD